MPNIATNYSPMPYFSSSGISNTDNRIESIVSYGGIAPKTSVARSYVNSILRILSLSKIESNLNFLSIISIFCDILSSNIEINLGLVLVSTICDVLSNFYASNSCRSVSR